MTEASSENSRSSSPLHQITAPPVDVNDLMARIRTEARRRAAAGISDGVMSASEALPFPPPRPALEAPQLHVGEGEELLTAQKFNELIRRALSQTEVSSKVPRIFRRLFRRQGAFNKVVLQTLQLLMKSEQRLFSQNRNTTTYLEAQGYWLQAKSEAQMIERTWLCALPPLINDQNLKVSDLGATLANVATDFDLLREGIDKFQTSLRLTIEDVETGKTNFTKVRSALEDLESRIRHDLGATQLEAKLLNESFVRFESRIASAEAAHLEHATQFKDVSDRTAAAANLVREVEQSATASREHLNGLQQWVEQVDSSNQLAVKERAELREHVNGLQQWLEQVSNSREEIMKTAASIQRTVTEQHQSLIAQFENLRRSINTEILSIDTRQISDASFLKGQLSLQGRLIEIAGANKSRNGRLRNTGNKQDEEVASNHEYDAFYLAFEDRFRGSRSEIKERCRVYLPFLKRVPTSNKRGLLLDIGCGRGEWLELLTESKYTCASGVDLNVSMVELCRERRLDVTLVDGVKHLATLPGDKLTLITAFHFIEHLGVRQLMKLLAEAHRVLKKGGLAIFETPNPQNILVGASDFYRDMTHSNPVHPDTIAFALESVGFTDVACYFLAAEKNGRKAIPQPDFRFDDLTAYVNVPRDFAVIARKA